MISIIAAMAKNRVIGYKNEIPWHISEDLIRAKKITMGHPIIMGQATHESISRFRKGGKWDKEPKLKREIEHRLLPGRTNIILSSDQKYKVPGGIVVHSIEEALKEAEKDPGSNEIFFIGGASIYKQTIDIADKIYLTVVDIEPKGDVFFPEFNETDWIITDIEKHQHSANNKYGYKYVTYLRKLRC